MSATTAPTLYSTGEAARQLQCSPSLLAKMERLGVVEPVGRLAGSGRRVYRVEDIDRIKAIRAAREAARAARQGAA